MHKSTQGRLEFVMMVQLALSFKASCKYMRRASCHALREPRSLSSRKSHIESTPSSTLHPIRSKNSVVGKSVSSQSKKISVWFLSAKRRFEPHDDNSVRPLACLLKFASSLLTCLLKFESSAAPAIFANPGKFPTKSSASDEKVFNDCKVEAVVARDTILTFAVVSAGVFAWRVKPPGESTSSICNSAMVDSVTFEEDVVDTVMASFTNLDIGPHFMLSVEP
mmetsp:Transcript_87718/g.196416  ORF Transcript_87718/g.196416 Transcript_87718/m.196416 type:complete len:222 (+) Transcript_87718:632-1297(+)